MIANFNASAPVGVYEITCLEITHETFDAPLRIYHPGYDPLTVTTEAMESQTYQACAFDTTPPSSDDSGRISRSLTIDGVDGSLIKALVPASQSEEPITATVRTYLSNDLTAPQFLRPEVLTLTNISVSKTTITATAENEDVINRRFPRVIYTTDNTPGLKR